MNILRESMIKTHTVTPEFSIRVWRDEPIDAKMGSIDHMELQSQIRALVQSDDTPVSYAKRILALPRISAVEVLNRNGNGTVLYRDWP